MSAPGAFDTVVIEAVMVQQRAATAEVTQGTNSRGQLGWQDRHVRPVEKSVLQKVVAHTFLDRRKAAPMAMSVHQARHQQLSAVTDDADTGIFGRDCGKRSRLPDGAVHDHNCAGRDHPRCSEARIGDCICAPHDDGLGHSLAPLQFGEPALPGPWEYIFAPPGSTANKPKPATLSQVFGELFQHDKREMHVPGYPQIYYVSNEQTVPGKRYISVETFMPTIPITRAAQGDDAVLGLVAERCRRYSIRQHA